jgi:hypothetical protein
MMRIMRIVWLVALVGALVAVDAQELGGTWTLAENPGALTLTLRSERQGGLSGTILDSRGASYQVTGELADGIAAGVAVGTDGGFWFEAGLQGDLLILVMVEPGPNGLPDMRTAVQFSFIRQGSGLSRSEPSASVPPARMPQVTTPPGPPVPLPSQPATAQSAGTPAHQPQPWIRGRFPIQPGGSRSRFPPTGSTRRTPAEPSWVTIRFPGRYWSSSTMKVPQLCRLRSARAW